MEEKLNKIQTEFTYKIGGANSLKEIDQLFIALFGKNGKVDSLSKEFINLTQEQLKKIGPLFNQIKHQLENEIETKRESIKEKTYLALGNENLVLTNPLQKKRVGHYHPLMALEKQTIELFNRLGFVQIDAPLIDTDFNNFEVLNIPQDHPARDLWDTFYIDTSNYHQSNHKLLLRTHTSNAQIKILKNNKPPIRMMTLGRCFRYENLDARHEHTFEQFELVYVDKGVSMANLQYLSEYYLKEIFGQDIKVRLKPKYYPFVEPGVGVDGLCIFCKGKGCKICGEVGWLELAGAGMIHPNVLKKGGIDPKIYSGIAWGMGPPRMAMLKLGIEDIRLFNSGDLSILQNKLT